MTDKSLADLVRDLEDSLDLYLKAPPVATAAKALISKIKADGALPPDGDIVTDIECPECQYVFDIELE